MLQLLAEGRQAKEIAAMANRWLKTVQFYRYRIMESLGVHTVAELVRHNAKHGIVG